jgi:hypothetical protein
VASSFPFSVAQQAHLTASQHNSGLPGSSPSFSHWDRAAAITSAAALCPLSADHPHQEGVEPMCHPTIFISPIKLMLPRLPFLFFSALKPTHPLISHRRRRPDISQPLSSLCDPIKVVVGSPIIPRSHLVLQLTPSSPLVSPHRAPMPLFTPLHCQPPLAIEPAVGDPGEDRHFPLRFDAAMTSFCAQKRP